ncbi:hypothetical protein Trydic_g19267 [Trypoxylus dichotomus]
MVCEINQLFGEQNGILREVRSAAEKSATAAPTRAPAIPRQTYAGQVKKEQSHGRGPAKGETNGVFFDFKYVGLWKRSDGSSNEEVSRCLGHWDRKTGKMGREFQIPSTSVSTGVLSNFNSVFDAMASNKNDGVTTRRVSVDSVGGTPEEECLKRVRALTGAILELVPVKSEILKIEDRKKLRGMVCELNQLFGEQNGILREVRAMAEKRAPIVECVQGKPKQTGDDTKKQLAEKVDVVAKKIGVHGIKKGRDGAVFVECSSKQDAEKLRVSVAEKMQAKTREMKKSNPVVCIYGVDAALTAEQVSECVRQQNESVENAYENGEEMREDFKIFRFATPKDNKRAVKNVVCSASPKLRSIFISGKIKVMWRVCAVKDYSNVLYCFKCLKVGHKSKDCKGELTCKKCAGGHDLKDCKAKEAKWSSSRQKKPRTRGIRGSRFPGTLSDGPADKGSIALATGATKGAISKTKPKIASKPGEAGMMHPAQKKSA